MYSTGKDWINRSLNEFRSDGFNGLREVLREGGCEDDFSSSCCGEGCSESLLFTSYFSEIEGFGLAVLLVEVSPVDDFVLVVKVWDWSWKAVFDIGRREGACDGG